MYIRSLPLQSLFQQRFIVAENDRTLKIGLNGKNGIRSAEIHRMEGINPKFDCNLRDLPFLQTVSFYMFEYLIE